MSLAPTSLRLLAWLFLRLGLTSFGGPAAHTALMQQEFVTRRKWLSTEAFLELVSATNLIPGPNSTELAIHLGYQQRGWRGLVVAGVCFIVPAASLSAGLAWFYVTYGHLPSVKWLLYGVQPVIVAVIAQAIWQLAPRTLPTWPLRTLAVAIIGGMLLQLGELTLLLGAGALSLLLAWRRANHLAATTAALVGAGATSPPVRATPLLIAAASSTAATKITSVAAFQLFVVFCKIGALLFGSGYVLIAFLRSEFVLTRGWLTEAQLLDAVAVGQLTPGPVFSSASFVGYLLGGGTGAVTATVGIFLPAFVFVAISIPLLARMQRSALAKAFLTAVNVASLVIMARAGAQLAVASLGHWQAWLIAALSFIGLVRYKVNSTWLIAGGAVVAWMIWAPHG